MEARAWVGDRTNARKAYARFEQQLTEELSDKLDDAMNNEGEKRAALQKESAALAAKYLAYVNGDPLIKDGLLAFRCGTAFE